MSDVMELKPCPFCGQNRVKVTKCISDEKRKAVQCLHCDVRTKFYNSAEEAAAVWNRRENKKGAKR